MPFFDPIRIGASGADTAYEVERSLRFNKADDVYLTRTPSSTGNQKVWTFSAWIKRTNLNNNHHYIYSAHSGSDYFALYIKDDKLHSYFSPSNNYGEVNSRLFRDVAAWFHIVHQVDAANTTQRIWINNVELSLNSGRNPSNSNFPMNESGVAMVVGNASWWLDERASDMYLAEVHYSDGNKYTPSDFVETDADTGQLIPKKVAITYGTNGYYLNFADNSGTTATTLGKDESGNGNNFTPNNFSVATGAGNDSVSDTPTNNFCTFNPLKVNASNPLVFTQGNLQHNGVSGDNHLRSATTMQVNSGKWYVEFKFVSGYEATNGTVRFGICTDAGHRDSNNDATWYQNTDNFLAIQYGNNGTVYRSETGTNTSELTGLSTFVNGDVMGIALDLDNDKFFVSKNGTFFSNGTGTQDPAAGTNPLYSGGVLTTRKSDGFYFNIDGYSAQVVTADFGQQGYAYTPPSGFKKVNSANLPDPTIKLPNKHFDTKLYTGNGSTGQTITYEFQPAFVWMKNRDAGNNHALVNAVVGRAKGLYPDSNSAEFNSSTGRDVSAFTSNGFTVGEPEQASSTNNNGSNIVAWAWNAGSSTVTNNDGSISSQVRANPNAGLSVVSYTATGSAGATVGHGLGVKPDVIITKRRNDQSNWGVYHQAITADKSLFLNLTNAEIDNSVYYNDTEPTSTVFTLGGSNESNGGNGDTYIAFCFSGVSQFSKFGSYTGNNNSDGPFVYTGFRPAWIMMKSISTGGSATYSWPIFDSKRSSYNIERAMLRANTSDAENSTATADVDILSNGFKPRYSPNETNGPNTYIYLAFAEFPFKYARAR